jgi:ATP-dependent Clp protease ATP-binding subunit ClpC
MSKGVIIDNKAYVLGEKVDQKMIENRIAKEKAAQMIGGVGFMFTIALFVLAVVVLFISNGTAFIFDFDVWTEPSFGMFLLFASFICISFLFSHQATAQTLKHHIPKRPHQGLVPEIQDVTSADNIDIVSFLDTNTVLSIESAFELAHKFGHQNVEPIHLFIGSMEDKNASSVFGRLGVEFQKIKDPLGRRLSSRQMGTFSGFSEESKEVLLSAFLNAYDQRQDAVITLEIFFESFKKDLYIQDLLQEQEVDGNQFANMVEWIRINEKQIERYHSLRKAAANKPTGAMNRSMTSVATPILDAFSEDLTTAAVQGRLPMLIGREKELEEIFRVIEGGRESVVLVGPEGVGKSGILAGIAALMVEERVPEILKDKRLVRISIPHLVSGVSPEVAQDRLIKALNEVSKSKNIVLAISDIEQLAGMATGQDVNLANLLVDFLSRGLTFSIATTTPQAYTASVERSVLSRIFQKVKIDEPDQKTSIQILESKVAQIEFDHKVLFSYAALEKAVSLTDRYIHETYLPKKAITIISEAALSVSKSKGEDALVSGEDVAKIVSQKTGVPITSAKSDEKDKLLHLEDEMHGRVIGQDEAVKAVASALRRARADLTNQNRPIASFLFLGSTGVGKTELAKTLAQTYFGNEQMMVRLDMSEFQDVRSIDKLIGAPGSGRGGLLSEAVRQRPFSIVLLDELEKASPDILNVFLQVLEDGRITDAEGRVVDFTNTIIIATSNAGTQYIQDAVAKNESADQIKTYLLETELREVYCPEFLNRFDGVVVFKPLEQAQIFEIAKLMIKQVSKRLEPKGIGFEATEEAVHELAVKGYDPKFGARPLRRVIQENVDNAIANALLEGKVKRRDTIILEKGGVIRIEQGKEL